VFPSSSESGFLSSVREAVVAQLSAQGFQVDQANLALPFGESDTKEFLRKLNSMAVAHRQNQAEKALKPLERSLLQSIVAGDNLNPAAIEPELRIVHPGTHEARLFRWASLHWSVPVSAGYGRRIRCLVWDRRHNALMGLVGLTDPVYALGPRERWIGWTKEQKAARLRHVMDAYVLGAVPPYSALLVGKFVAMLVASREVQEAFRNRYRDSVSYIRERSFDGTLALVTTASALGKSSLYNRIKYFDRRLYHSIGYSAGSGEFQFLNGVYHDLKRVAAMTKAPTAKNEKWGTGFRNRREVVRTALGALGLSLNLNYHGIKRELFAVPLADNTREFLCGRTDGLFYDLPTITEMWEFFVERWLRRRAAEEWRYRDFDPESYRLWSE
jgi:hypothetical protein